MLYSFNWRIGASNEPYIQRIKKTPGGCRALDLLCIDYLSHPLYFIYTRPTTGVPTEAITH